MEAAGGVGATGAVGGAGAVGALGGAKGVGAAESTARHMSSNEMQQVHIYFMAVMGKQ